MYYIYAYLSEDGTPYYIGKGTKNRAFFKTGPEKYKKPKDKSQIIIMESNLTEIGALALERFYIRWYGRKDNGTGILINKTDGGDGNLGLMVSEQSRKKMSLARIGKIPWNKGIRTGPNLEHSEFMKKKMCSNKIAKDRIWVNNGIISLMVKFNQIPTGFSLGRIYKRKAL